MNIVFSLLLISAMTISSLSMTRTDEYGDSFRIVKTPQTLTLKRIVSGTAKEIRFENELESVHITISVDGKRAAVASETEIAIWDCDLLFQRSEIRIIPVDEKVMDGRNLDTDGSMGLPEYDEMYPVVAISNGVLTTNSWAALDSRESISGLSFESFVTTKDSIGEMVFLFKLDKAGSKAFFEMTKKHIRERMAIVFQNRIYSMPVVQMEIENSEVMISGKFSAEDLNAIGLLFQKPALQTIPIGSKVKNFYFNASAGRLTAILENGEKLKIDCE